MDFKLLFAELEKTDEGKALVEGLKEYKSTADQNEKDLRDRTKDLEQFEGVDIAKLKSVSEFVDSHGGQDSILGVVAKAHGYEDDKARMQKDIDAKNATITKYDEESKAWQAERKAIELCDAVRNDFAVFNNDPNGLLMDKMLSDGTIFYDDNNNVMMKDGAGSIAFDATAIEKLKQSNPTLYTTPSGGGERGGVNGGNPKSSGATASYEDEMNALFE
ncbi:MAG: hypothetical protein GY774_00340 [Planctomycetes bacterium]|nr:hypothetical protein [Planctomycetota bacterium]